MNHTIAYAIDQLRDAVNLIWPAHRTHDAKRNGPLIRAAGDARASIERVKAVVDPAVLDAVAASVIELLRVSGVDTENPTSVASDTHQTKVGWLAAVALLMSQSTPRLEEAHTRLARVAHRLQRDEKVTDEDVLEVMIVAAELVRTVARA